MKETSLLLTRRAGGHKTLFGYNPQQKNEKFIKSLQPPQTTNKIFTPSEYLVSRKKGTKTLGAHWPKCYFFTNNIKTM